MLKKLCGLAIGSYIAERVEGCWQTEVVAFKNYNTITDYLTTFDEITMRFGVDASVAYQYSNFFSVDETIEVPDGKISFPCFTDGGFYLYVTENDEYQDDVAYQVVVGCSDFVEGENEIQGHLSERSDLITDVYD